MTAPQPLADWWLGWLSDTTLRVPDPSAAVEHWSELLGGTAAGDRVQFESGTSLRALEGAPGFASADLQLSAAEAPDIDEGLISDPDGRRLSVVRVQELQPRPDVPGLRLGHLTFESPDPLRAQSFYESLGFRLSEGLGPNFRWLRCNPIHHTVAFVRSDAPRLHHVGFELADRTALIDACDRLADLGCAIEYGPGRHLAGNNIFIYFLDNHGIRFEFFCELERVAPSDRDPKVHQDVPRERSINLWGPQPPEAYFRGV